MLLDLVHVKKIFFIHLLGGESGDNTLKTQNFHEHKIHHTNKISPTKFIIP